MREGADPSFHNNRALLQRIDALPEGPGWRCYPFELEGDELSEDGKKQTEVLEMWCRDPVECVRELLGNAAFTKQSYEPCRIFKKFENKRYSNREFNEAWTADWWWDIQVRQAAHNSTGQTHKFAAGTASSRSYARTDHPSL